MQATTDPTPGRGRAARSTRDLVLSMAVLVVPVLLLVIGYLVLFNGDRPVSVDPADSFAAATRAGAYPVLRPDSLPAGWSVASARFEPAGATLRVGYRAPGGGGLQLVQSAQPGDALLPAELGPDARPGNLVTLGGRQWRRYPSVRDGAALVLAGDRSTTIVLGSVPAAQLDDFAARLS